MGAHARSWGRRGGRGRPAWTPTDPGDQGLRSPGCACTTRTAGYALSTVKLGSMTSGGEWGLFIPQERAGVLYAGMDDVDTPGLPKRGVRGRSYPLLEDMLRR